MRSRKFRELLAPLIVSIDYGSSWRRRSDSFEQAALGREVLLEVVVVIEVVACKVGEYSHVILHAVHAPLCQRVRRNFHHRFRRSLAYAFIEEAIQVKSLWRGVWRLQYLGGDVVFDCANQHAAVTGGIQNRFQ